MKRSYRRTTLLDGENPCTTGAGRILTEDPVLRQHTSVGGPPLLGRHPPVDRIDPTPFRLVHVCTRDGVHLSPRHLPVADGWDTGTPWLFRSNVSLSHLRVVTKEDQRVPGRSTQWTEGQEPKVLGRDRGTLGRRRNRIRTTLTNDKKLWSYSDSFYWDSPDGNVLIFSLHLLLGVKSRGNLLFFTLNYVYTSTSRIWGVL